MPIDYSLITEIQKLKETMSTVQQDLQRQYPNKLVNDACYDYMQKALKDNPEIIMPSLSCLQFYQRLSKRIILKEIVTTFAKTQLRERLKHLVPTNHYCQANMFLSRFRSNQISQIVKPGEFVKFLENKKLIENPIQSASKPKR